MFESPLRESHLSWRHRFLCRDSHILDWILTNWINNSQKIQNCYRFAGRKAADEFWHMRRKIYTNPTFLFIAGGPGLYLGGECGRGLRWHWGRQWGGWYSRSWLLGGILDPLNLPKGLWAKRARGQRPDLATDLLEDPADPKPWRWEGMEEGSREFPPLGVGGK